MTSEEINIYCDESCHLEHEPEHVMLISCIYCPKDKVQQISMDLRALKENFGLSKRAELKWHKISKNKKNYYYELINYFVNNDDINFRTVVIPNKEKLKHNLHQQTHSSWYYKMIYVLIKYICKCLCKSSLKYNIYIDKKENSYEAKQEIIKLKECLSFAFFYKTFHVQNIVSDQSELMQLNDFIQGAISYYNRGYYNSENCNKIKQKIVEMLIKKLNIELDQTNSNKKCNILIWEADNIG